MESLISSMMQSARKRCKMIQQSQILLWFAENLARPEGGSIGPSARFPIAVEGRQPIMQ